MKRRLLTMMLAVIGMVAASAQDKEPKEPVGPLLNVSCSGPEQRADLIYASCAATHHGGLGKDFYEMYNDPGTKPKILSAFRYNTPEYTKKEYPITDEVVKGLQEKLYKIDLEEIRGYNIDEMMTGGTTYRVHLEFADGDQITAEWFTHEPLPEAVAVYSTIENYIGNVIKEMVKK